MITSPCDKCGRDGSGCGFNLNKVYSEYGVFCFRPKGSILIWDEVEFHTGDLGEEVAEYLRRVGK